MLGLVELLSSRGLDLRARVKVIRHQDKRFAPGELDDKELLEEYQRYQKKPVFECKYIVSFVGTQNSHARFHGVYKVAGRLPVSERPLRADLRPKYDWFAPKGGYFYELEEMSGFDDLKERVVIRWGGSTLSWHQWLSAKADKEVIEVLPVGYVREFPGYLNFVMTYDELAKIINNSAANREWHRMLSSVAGVYLILDVKTGQQYVGSAYGNRGILSRWASYAASGHGGNKKLRQLLKRDENYAKNFQFTVLETLSATLTKREVVSRERIHKRKLGSRAFGLNSN